MPFYLIFCKDTKIVRNEQKLCKKNAKLSKNSVNCPFEAIISQ